MTDVTSAHFSLSEAAAGRALGRTVAYGALAAVVLAAFFAEVGIGAVRIPLGAIVDILATGASGVASWDRIVLEFRLPRTINALVSGAGLGACGLLLQTLFRNPLADPFVLGVMHGAKLGVAMVVVFTGVAGATYASRFGLAGDVSLAVAAAVGATMVLALMLAVSRRVSTVTLLVMGLLLGYVCIGLISALMHFVDEVQARVFDGWEGGSFDGATHAQLTVLVPLVVAGIVLACALSKPLNALLIGDRYAQTMGVSVMRVRVLAFACIALLAGTVTAYCGPIPFLGLVAAHLAKGLFRTSDHRVLMPAAALVGAALALTTDLVIHLPWNRHFLHLDAVIGLVGAPIALWVLLRGRQARALEL